MQVGVPNETYAGERRVALVPAHIPMLAKAGFGVVVEAGAGISAGFTDEQYRDKGAEIASSRHDVFSRADVVLQVRTLGANPDEGKADLEELRTGQMVIGFAEPLTAIDAARAYAEKGVSLFSMELMPRITRAQSMDALSSAASLAGYKAVLLAAAALPRIFPMMMTAAGTLKPARVLIVGAGVAGLQAIATAKRLGAVVSAYDVRPAVKEQVESLGAKFVELPLDTAGAEDKGGYAKEQSEEQVRKQQELMSDVVAASDVVITTAAIPGKKAPIIVTADMVKRMAPGSVIVDLAAERGGNCELTKPGETVEVQNVTILGPENVPSTVAADASSTYSKNLVTFLQHLAEEGSITIDREDEITASTLVTHGNDIVHPAVRKAAGLPEAPKPGASPAPSPDEGEKQSTPEKS